MGFDRDVGQFVDKSTSWMQGAFNSLGTYNPLGPVESSYVHGTPHQDIRAPGGALVTAGQGTMRAHHVADREIQQMVCDYMNNAIPLSTLLDRLGTLYLTSWVDVIVAPRIMKIWIQWVSALTSALATATSEARGLTKDEQAAYATSLSAKLSGSVANLRVGHQQTDAALGYGIAPRLQRGQYDLFALFIEYANGHDFSRRTLSVETSLVRNAWAAHFAGHILAPGGRSAAVNNVFVGPGSAPGSIFISKQNPLPPSRLASMPMPQSYPGTSGRSAYILRGTRAVLQVGAVVAVLAGIGFGFKSLLPKK